MSERTPMTAFLVDLFPRYGAWLDEQPEQKSPSLRLVRPQVYAIRIVKTSYVKLGFSNSPNDRLVNLQISNPLPLELLAAWVVPNRAVERQLHNHFHAVKTKGEWFDMASKDIQALFTFMKDYKRAQ